MSQRLASSLRSVALGAEVRADASLMESLMGKRVTISIQAEIYFPEI